MRKKLKDQYENKIIISRQVNIFHVAQTEAELLMRTSLDTEIEITGLKLDKLSRKPFFQK